MRTVTNTHKIRGKNHKERATDLYKNSHIWFTRMLRRSGIDSCALRQSVYVIRRQWLTYCYKMANARIYEMELTQAALIF